MALMSLLAPPVSAEPSDSYLADIGPAPEVRLTDQDGRPFALSDLRGKVVLVGFVYTTCGGTCPATTHRMVLVQEALREAGLWGERVEFVSISLDPERDRPDVLGRYARIYDADLESWHFLTGSPEEVSEVLDAWGMWAKVNDQGVLDHPSRIFLLDPRGHRREIYSLEFLQTPTVLRDMRSLLGGSPGR